jgi:protein-tyrosine phosphatase
MFKKWFAGSEKFYGDFAFLGIDMHSHLVPGIDDGSQYLEDSIRFIQTLQKLGWKGCITTPHILSDLYPNNKASIEAAFAPLKQRLSDDFYFAYAAEYMVDEYFEGLLQNEELLLFKGNHVLIEMSYLAASPRIKDVIFQLRVKGYQPVLAHPERYNFYHRDLEKYTEFIDMGCQLQLNLLSVIGYYGSAVKSIALKLLSSHMYTYAGTDLHHQKHIDALQQLTKNKIYKELSAYNFRNVDLL